jgi:peroxiredoxin
MPPTLADIYERVSKLPGVTFTAEMIRPASMSLSVRIAPGGYMWAKYPTNEQFVSVKESVTWFPDKKEYSRGPAPDYNPLFGGFEALWPAGAKMEPAGNATETKFGNKDAWAIPAKAAASDGVAGHAVTLYVDKTTLFPLGTLASANGQTYEMRYSSLDTRPVSPDALTFRVPKGALPYVARDPRSGLIARGANVPAFAAKDIKGKVVAGPAVGKTEKGLIVNFWFSACLGCIKELPWFAKVAPELQKQGIRTVGINPVDTVSAIQKTLALHQIGYPILAGKDAQQIATRFGVKAFPVTVVVDTNNKAVAVISGFDEAALRTAVSKLGGTLGA